MTPDPKPTSASERWREVAACLEPSECVSILISDAAARTKRLEWDVAFGIALCIEQQRERIASLAADKAKLEGIIMGTTPEYRVTLGVNVQRYWSAEDRMMLRRILFPEVGELEARIKELEDLFVGGHDLSVTSYEYCCGEGREHNYAIAISRKRQSR